MLSFDISDRQISIVKGNNSGGKIHIDRSCQIAIPDEMIINGEVMSLSGVAELIVTNLKAEEMMDKEAIISFSSSNIVFKELIVPNGKGEQFLTMVQNQMVHEMGITDEYSISYSIVGDAGEANPGSLKVLATACPSSIVESYRKLFNIVGISLKSVNICCNSISRIVLADPGNIEKMPLLVIQISKEFLGLTLFENGHTAFARYTPVSADDYETEDYIYEAINENIFRMAQFNRARGGPGISNVIAYGEIPDFIKLSDALSQMDVKTSILPVPNTITGFENFEFTDFANAIGALYKRNKQTERINLLEVDSKTGRSGAGLNSFLATSGVIVAASAIVILAITLLVGIKEKGIIDDTDKLQERIAAADKQIEQSAIYQDAYTKITEYNDQVQILFDAIDSKPVITKATLDTLNKLIGEDVSYDTFSYDSSGSITLGNLVLPNQKNPSEMMERLEDSGEYSNITYSGWSSNEEKTKVTIPSITLTLK